VVVDGWLDFFSFFFFILLFFYFFFKIFNFLDIDLKETYRGMKRP